MQCQGEYMVFREKGDATSGAGSPTSSDVLRVDAARLLLSRLTAAAARLLDLLLDLPEPPVLHARAWFSPQNLAYEAAVHTSMDLGVRPSFSPMSR